MTLEIKIDLREIDAFVATIGALPEFVGPEISKTMQEIVDLLESATVGETPVNTGQLRGSYYTELRGDPLGTLTGEVGSPLVYGEPVEYGREAGKQMPPVDAIELWVIRKLQIRDPQESRRMAWAIAMKIARSGTTGAKMMERGWTATEPYANRLLEELPEKILNYLRDA